MKGDDKYRVEVRLLGSKSGRMTLNVKTLHEGEDRDEAERAFSDTAVCDEKDRPVPADGSRRR